MVQEKTSKAPAVKAGVRTAKGQSSREDNAALALPILKHMHFVDIHLLKLDAIRHPEFDTVSKKNGLNIKPSERVEVAYHEANHGVMAIVTLGVEGLIGDAKVFSVTAIYRALYTVKDSFDGDQVEERAIAFCHSTAMAHVWPYWRETLVSTSTKMGLPPILAPLLIVGAKAPSEKK